MQHSQEKNKTALEKLDELYVYYRTNFNLNLTQFAKVLGCSYSQIRKLYVYRKKPGFNTVILIDNLYEVMNMEKNRSHKEIAEMVERQRKKDLAFTKMYLQKPKKKK